MEHREALTIRFPAALLNRARELKRPRESLNDMVIDAFREAMRRREGMAVAAEILKMHEQMLAEGGLQPDSGPIIRSLRDDTDCGG